MSDFPENQPNLSTGPQVHDHKWQTQQDAGLWLDNHENTENKANVARNTVPYGRNEFMNLKKDARKCLNNPAHQRNPTPKGKDHQK